MKKVLLLIILFTIHCSLFTAKAQCTGVSITTQPTNQNDSIPGHAHFSVAVSGDAPFNYYWYVNGNLVDSTIGSASANNTYNTPALTMADSNNTYYCIITNCAGANTVTTDTVPLLCMPVMITIQPLSQTFTAGTTTTISFSVTVSGTPPFTYKWYKNGTTLVQTTTDTIGHTSIYSFAASPVVHGMNGWTFGVTVTNCRCGLGSSCTSAGCSVVSSVAVMTVNCPAMSAPSASVFGLVSGSTCSGASYTLNTPTVAGATYNWSGSDGFTSSLQNPTATGYTNFLYCSINIIYTITETINGCTSPPGTVSAHIYSPTLVDYSPYGGSGSICSGDVVEYWLHNNSQCGYINSLSTSFPPCIHVSTYYSGWPLYQYYDTLTNISTTPCGINYQLEADNYPCHTWTTFYLTINPAPHITTTSSYICLGDTAHITASGATTYIWSAGATATGIGTATALPLTTTTYTVTGTNTYGCSNTATSTVTVVDTINNGITTSNDTIYANQAGATYQWLNCNTGYTPIAGATNSYYVVTANGHYAVAITIGSCKDTSTCASFQTVGVNEITNQQSQIEIYPNPTSATFTITSQDRIESIKVYNVLGECVWQNSYQNTTSAIIDLTVNIPSPSGRSGGAGIYFAEIKTKHAKVNRKIIKQ